MIYVFEGGSIVYDGRTISEEQKLEAVAVHVLPEPEIIEGKIAVLKANKAEERIYYEYIDKPKDSEIEQLREDMNGAIMELTMLIAMGGI